MLRTLVTGPQKCFLRLRATGTYSLKESFMLYGFTKVASMGHNILHGVHSADIRTLSGSSASFSGRSAGPGTFLPWTQSMQLRREGSRAAQETSPFHLRAARRLAPISVLQGVEGIHEPDEDDLLWGDTSEQGGASETAASSVRISLPEYCAGCGIRMQTDNPQAPGFFQVPKKILEDGSGIGRAEDEPTLEEVANMNLEEGKVGSDGAASAGEGRLAYPPEPRANDAPGRGSGDKGKAIDALGNMMEDWLDEEEQRTRPAPLVLEEEVDDGRPTVFCARCHSLRNSGRVKSAAAEAALPDFDLARKVGRKLALQKFRRSVVLCVVDIADFDGSLPRAALSQLLETAAGGTPGDMQEGRGDKRDEGRRERRDTRDDVALVLAVNKSDLLPNQVTPIRLEQWVRRRTQQAGLPRPEAVALVSAAKGWGVRELLTLLHRLVGNRGDVWVVGAQNAGKSSLINAMRKAVGRGGAAKEITTAPLPGTTLGLLRVGGLMPPGCKMLDSPGVPHQHQLTTLLTPDEVRLLLPRQRLRPRTFRAAPGQTVLLGGIARIDVISAPGATLYLTVWASSDVVCHFGKTDGADERYQKHAGTLLTPPVGDESRLEAMGPLMPTDVRVEGSEWLSSSTDIAIAGLGWVGVGVKGWADLRVWTHEGVAITTHAALVPDYARDFERPGFGSLGQPRPHAGTTSRRGNNAKAAARR